MQEQDYFWFEENYPELQKKFGDAFLAIKNKTVLGSYSTYAEGVRTTEKTEELGTFIVQECKAIGSILSCSIASMSFEEAILEQ